MLEGMPTPLSTQGVAEMLQAGAWGLSAGVVGAMAKSRTWRLPKLIVIREEDGSRSYEVDWGTVLAAPLCGMVLAMIFDGRPQTAIAYGLAGGFVGPALINGVVDAVLHRLGITVTEAPRLRESRVPGPGSRVVRCGDGDGGAEGPQHAEPEIGGEDVPI